MNYNFDNERPIYLQIVEIIKEHIISGILKPNQKLPSVREYAAIFKANPNTVVKSLMILEQEGYIYTERTNGKFVADNFNLFKLEKENYDPTLVSDWPLSADGKEYFEYLIQILNLTDLMSITRDPVLGNDLKTMILNNNLLKSNKTTAEGLIEARGTGKYKELVRSINFEDIIPDVKEVLKNYCNYIDFDKLLLICANKYEQVLEKTDIILATQKGIKEILEVILKNYKKNIQSKSIN